MKRLKTAIIAFMAIVPTWAQMDNVVEVENTYTPQVKDANKINVVPEKRIVTVNRRKVDYADSSLPLSSGYVFQPLSVTQGETIVTEAKKGFFTAGGGSLGNLLIRGAIGLDLTSKDRLDIDLGLNGFNGNTTEKINSVFGYEKWKSRFYTSSGTVSYTHSLSPQSALYARASFSSQVFNYMNEYLDASNAAFTDKQHNSIGALSAGITPYSLGRFSVGAEASYMFFKQKYATTLDDANEENIFMLKSDLKYEISRNNSLALDLGIRGTQYGMKVDAPLHDDFKNTFGFSFAPRYEFSGDKVGLTVGLRGYASSGYENSFNMAPDISVVYHYSDKMDIYAHVTGGEVYNDFRRFSSLTPYWTFLAPMSGAGPTPLQHIDQFDQLRALLGVRTKLIAGLYADLSVGYDVSKNRTEIALYGNGASAASIFTADGNRLHANVHIRYDYADKLSVDLKNTFNSWTKIEVPGEYEKQNVLSRPVIDLDWNISWRMLSALRLGVDYQYQSFRSSESAVLPERPATSNLNAELSYSFPIRLTLYAKAMNILNHKHHCYYGVPALGTSFMAGAAITF